MLTVLGGLPGTGKTTLSRLVARSFGAALLRVDAVEVVLVAAGVAPSQRSLGPVGYDVVAAVARTSLLIGTPVVVDAVNAVDAARTGWRALAAACGVPLLEVEVVCSDAAEHRRRVESRISDLAGQRVPTWAEIEAIAWEPWPGALVVDTADGPDAGLAAIRTRN